MQEEDQDSTELVARLLFEVYGGTHAPRSLLNSKANYTTVKIARANSTRRAREVLERSLQGDVRFGSAEIYLDDSKTCNTYIDIPDTAAQKIMNLQPEMPRDISIPEELESGLYTNNVVRRILFCGLHGILQILLLFCRQVWQENQAEKMTLDQEVATEVTGEVGVEATEVDMEELDVIMEEEDVIMAEGMIMEEGTAMEEGGTTMEASNGAVIMENILGMEGIETGTRSTATEVAIAGEGCSCRPYM